jgi:hypothetical protein
MPGFMDSEHASSVKKQGHKEEDVFALEENGTVIYGKKVDVLTNDGKKYQLKRGFRWQWALYSSKETIASVPYLNDIFSKLIENEYVENRSIRIENQKNLMKSGVEILQDKNKLKEFLDYMIFGNEQDLNHRFNFDKEIIYTEKKDLLKDLVFCDVVSSRGDRKIILKKERNIIEIEVRSDKKSILMVTTAFNFREHILYKNKNYKIVGVK